MKQPLPELPPYFTPYHKVTVFVEYIAYLYNSLPETSPLIDDDAMHEVCSVFKKSYNQIISTVSDMDLKKDNYENDDFYESMPLKELYVVSHRYNEDIIDFELFKAKWSTRSARIGEILSDLE